MKKYNKPEMSIQVINLETSIALSGTMTHMNNFGNDAGTVTWDDLFGEN